MGIDAENHFSCIDTGDGCGEGRVFETKGEDGGEEPAFLEFDAFDSGVRDFDEFHFVSAGEDVAFDAPVEVDVVCMEAEMAIDFFAAEVITRRDREVDINGVVAKHSLGEVNGDNR